MKIAIIGSRNFKDKSLLDEVLNSYKDKVTMIVSGGAKGADTIGESWAKENNIPTQIFLPKWEKFGKSAGFIRNNYIIENSDEIIAFWDGVSKGTQHSISLCKKLNKNCKIILF